MITAIGNVPVSTKYLHSDYPPELFSQFYTWLIKQRFYQFDVETDVTESWINKKLITVQFGSLDGETQWFLQWSQLGDYWKQLIKVQLEREDTTKLIHNAMFETIVMLSNGIVIENVYDTMLAEQVLIAGREPKPPSLNELTQKYLGITLDKTEQTTFGDNIMTESKVLYAVDDVKYLGAIMRMQIPELQAMDQDWVAALENEVVLSYAEMTFNGFDFDQKKWRNNIELAQPLITDAQSRLNDWLKQEPFYSIAKAKGYIAEHDSVEIKWTSPKQRGALLQVFFPEVPGASLGVVKRYLKENKDILDEDQIRLIESFLAKDYSLLEQLLIQDHRERLISDGLLIPAGVIRINWNSVDQVRPLIQAIAPRLKDLSEESLAKLDHGVVKALHDYKNNLKLVSTYGEAFIEKHVDVDGKVRTSFNQIVSTGRVSSRKPNLQNIPVEGVGPRYREAFVAPPGWKVVGADMSSQELVIIATLSQDPVWLKSLRDGEDLHSTTSELLYGQKWKDAAEPGCAYYNNGHVKCKCTEHEHMRYKVKRINYGLAYGMSEIKLSGELGISRDEALALMERYFKTFPRISNMLNGLGAFGVQNGYSMTMAPYFRRRYYSEWRFYKPYINAHLNEVEYNHGLGAIERASKNMPKILDGHIKLGELLETPNVKTRTISSQATQE